MQGFDLNGVRVADSSRGNTLNKSIAFDVVAWQTYYVGAVPVGEGANGAYCLEADFNQDAGNALETPSNVDPNFSQTQSIGLGNDSNNNFRTISADAGTLVANVTNVSAPVDLHLCTVDGTCVTSSSNAGNADEQISLNLNANTAYVIAVTPTSSSAEGFYDINSSFTVSFSAQSAASVKVVDEDQVGS